VSPEKLRFVVAAAENKGQSSSYMAEHEVRVDDIYSVAGGVPTPTLVLVDRAGVVKKVWAGRLNDGQQELVKALEGVCSSGGDSGRL
jgi:hypothetical protein